MRKWTVAATVAGVVAWIGAAKQSIRVASSDNAGLLNGRGTRE